MARNTLTSACVHRRDRRTPIQQTLTLLLANPLTATDDSERRAEDARTSNLLRRLVVGREVAVDACWRALQSAARDRTHGLAVVDDLAALIAAARDRDHPEELCGNPAALRPYPDHHEIVRVRTELPQLPQRAGADRAVTLDEARLNRRDLEELVANELGTDLNRYVPTLRRRITGTLRIHLGAVVPILETFSAFLHWVASDLQPGSRSRRHIAHALNGALLDACTASTGDPGVVADDDNFLIDMPVGQPCGAQGNDSEAIRIPPQLALRAERTGRRSEALDRIVGDSLPTWQTLPLTGPGLDPGTMNALKSFAAAVTRVGAPSELRGDASPCMQRAVLFAYAVARVQLDDTDRQPMPSLVNGKAAAATTQLRWLSHRLYSWEVMQTFEAAANANRKYTQSCRAPDGVDRAVLFSAGLGGIGIAIAEQLVDPPRLPR